MNIVFSDVCDIHTKQFYLVLVTFYKCIDRMLIVSIYARCKPRSNVNYTDNGLTDILRMATSRLRVQGLMMHWGAVSSTTYIHKVQEVKATVLLIPLIYC